MDYLTRGSVAAQGIRGRLLRRQSNWPHLSALGVRVGRNGTLSRREIVTALDDIGVTIELPTGDRLDASAIEMLLADIAPADLKQRIDAFLDELRRKAQP